MRQKVASDLSHTTQGLALSADDRLAGYSQRKSTSHTTQGLALSAHGRYLPATLSNGGLRVFDREKNWSEVFRDTDYGASTDGAAFASDGRLATTSDDDRIRLYDRSFHLIASQDAPAGHDPIGLAFHPDGNVLAVGYYNAPSVELLDGYSLARLPGPNTDDLKGGGLHSVAWSIDGQTLFAGGRYEDDRTTPVFGWSQSGLGTRPGVVNLRQG